MWYPAHISAITTVDTTQLRDPESIRSRIFFESSERGSLLTTPTKTLVSRDLQSHSFLSFL